MAADPPEPKSTEKQPEAPRGEGARTGRDSPRHNGAGGSKPLLSHILTAALALVLLLVFIQGLRVSRVSVAAAVLSVLALVGLGAALSIWLLAVRPALLQARPRQVVALHDELSPEEYLQAAFDWWDQRAQEGRREKWRFGHFTAFLGTAAVLLLVLQVILAREPGPVSVALIFLELMALLTVLSVGFLGVAGGGEWVRDRLRAELFRREQFLLLARVGPYLDAGRPGEVAAVVRQRVGEMHSLASKPIDFLPLREPDGTDWRDALVQAGEGQSAPLDPQSGVLDRFVKTRLQAQARWFAARAVEWARHDARLQNVAKGALTGALAMAVVHLVVLLHGQSALHGASHGALGQVIEVAALSLPAIGAAVAALQSLGEGKRLSRSYRHVARELSALNRALVGLRRQHLRGAIAQPAYEFQLKRLMLATEELLARELHDWWLIMHVVRPAAGH